MKIIENKFIPFSGYMAVNVFGFVFTRSMKKMKENDINHEAIHTAQMKEMLYVFFYLWYVTEWIARLLFKGNAYKSICFEREAYNNECDLEYLKKRRHYDWLKNVTLKNI